MLSTQLPPRAPFARSVETRMMEQELAKLGPGDFISYAALAQAAGLQEVFSGTPALVTARKVVQRERGYVTTCRNGEGVVRETDTGVVGSVLPKAGKSIRRKAKRALVKAATVDFSKLPMELQKQFSTHASLLSVTVQFHGKRQIEKLEASVPVGQRQLPIADTLAIFGKK